MKSLIILFICFGLLNFANAQNKYGTLAQDHSLSKEKEELLMLEYKSLAAEFALDTVFLSSVIDESCISISEGGVHNKQQYLLGMYNNISQRNKDGLFVDSFKLEDVVLNIYSTTAVITFVVHTYRKTKGVANERRTRFYDVWVKQEKRWKLVASQGTPLTQ